MEKKKWKYITLVFVIIGISLWVFSAVPIVTEGTSSITNHVLPSGIDISKWDLDVVNAQKMEPLSIASESLDQLQDSIACWWSIGLGPKDYWMVQSTKNYREPLNGFSVGISRQGMPSDPIFLGIMYPTGQNPEDPNNFNVLGYVLASQLPEEHVYYSFGLDLSVNIPPETFFYVAALSGNIDTSNQWHLGASGNNPYDRGVLGCWDFINKWWQCPDLDECRFDMCFTTYTVPNGGQPEPPTITITSNYKIISQVLGSFSLLGAAISGTKYFSLVV